MILSNKALEKALIQRQQQIKKFDIGKHLFPEQLAFVNDKHPYKIAVCSRRAGKTIACVGDLVRTALETPEIVCLYINLSRDNAKKIIWSDLKKINREYELKGVEKISDLSITFPNRSKIYLSGAKDTKEIEKFRGLALKLVYIDEVQSFREYIRDLVDHVIVQALMDYAGTLVLTGTPGAIPSGFFHESWFGRYNEEGTFVESTWSKHSWTFWNNPFIAQKSKMTHQEILDRELKRRGVTVDNPSIQREYFGRWVLDTDSLLIHYNKNLNDYQYLPTLKNNKKYQYIMGIDLGFDDADAIAVIAFEENSPKTYLVEEIVVPQQGITELVKQVETLQKKYDIVKMVIDQGGLGKKIAEEMRRRHAIPVQPADKARKMENIALLNDALLTGRMLAHKESRFAQDSYLVEIDRNKSTPDKIKVSDNYHSDIIDAVLYAFRESPAFSWQPEQPKPLPGTKEWAKGQEDEMFEQTMKQLQDELEIKRRMDNIGYD